MDERALVAAIERYEAAREAWRAACRRSKDRPRDLREIGRVHGTELLPAMLALRDLLGDAPVVCRGRIYRKHDVTTVHVRDAIVLDPPVTPPPPAPAPG